jgi:DNA modification methylase/transcriptional regulator with XRE-family HTH domain
MTGETFLDGRVTLRPGDCREVLKTLPPASIDAVVTDPPYALVSIVKRFGNDNAAPAKAGADGLYARASAGFMGQQWDTGETAFAIEFWREVFRVLKPGGHVAAFSGTRTYHRMTVAIEDAGFEIRDQLAWLYGSGFPKSHDVSKAIDKRKDWSALPKLQAAIRLARSTMGLSQTQAARRMGLIGPTETLGGGGFMWFETGQRVPTREQWPALKKALGLSDDFDAAFEEAEREIVGYHDKEAQAARWRADYSGGEVNAAGAITRAATEAAQAWEGWGTALKPAWEPICLGRKPLVGTVAENVLAHGTGALNIGGCRVEGEKTPAPVGHFRGSAVGATGLRGIRDGSADHLGRWPANIVHDGSDEVVDAFPGDGAGFGLNGSAARFFYTAKADAEDRIGSKHPTVKPVSLMQWLCRLVTPKGGVILDPFAGTGTTGEAAWREGFSAILVEREAQFQADIRRRLTVAASPSARQAAAAKGDRDLGALPLFGGAAE